jgi:hypothetical protein
MVAFCANIFSVLSGPLGLSVVGINLLWALMKTMKDHHMEHLAWALFGGGGIYGISWWVSEILSRASGA